MNKNKVKQPGLEDTSFNIGPDNVTVDVEVDPDEFSLEEKQEQR